MTDLDIILSKKSVVVIDDDELMLQLIKGYCLELGFAEVVSFTSVEPAWDAMKERETPFDFIISDWKMPGLGGVGFFNRVKVDKLYSKVPFLVVSGFLEQNDFILLEDYPLSSLLEKPFTKTLITKKIEGLINEQMWLEDNETIIADIIKKYAENEDEANTKIVNSLKSSPSPVSFGIHLSKRLREQKMYKPAKTVIGWVVKKAPKSVMAMTECARIFKETGNLKEALDLIDFTNTISPDNIERLCMSGEINLQLNQPEQAKEVFSKALKIDDKNVVAKAGSSISNNLEEHLLTHDSYNLPNSFAGVLNLLAIKKVKNGDYSEGMDQYDSALVFISDPTTQAKLKFNRGLGYLKWGKKEEALDEFKESLQLGGDDFSRSQKFVNKI